MPRPLQVGAAFTWRLLVIIAGIWVLLWVLNFFSSLVIPFLVAVLLAALLTPLVQLLARWLPRGLAVAVTFLLALGVVAGLFTLVGTQIASQMTQLTSQALDGFSQMQDWLAKGPLNINTAQIDDYVGKLQEQVTANGERIASGALTATLTAGEVLTGLLLTLFTLIFLLYDGNGIWGWFVRLLPKRARQASDTAGRAGWVALTQYVRATVIVAFVDAVGIGVGAAILGVPLYIPLAVLVFLGAFIPIIGALVSGAVAVLVALLALGWVQALIMLAVVLAVQQIESHILQPVIMGRMVSIHPLGVVMAIGAGLVVKGIVGALFAVPLAAVLNTVIHSLSAGGAPLRRLAADDAAGRPGDPEPGDPGPDDPGPDDPGPVDPGQDREQGEPARGHREAAGMPKDPAPGRDRVFGGSDSGLTSQDL